MAGPPITIARSNLSAAWGQAFLEVLDRPAGKCPPLVVSIGGFTSPLPSEDVAIRQAVDAALAANKCNSCDVSAMVIFPYKLWMRRQNMTCDEFSDLCISNLLPRLRSLDQRNRHGTYFERLMAFEGRKNGKATTTNQLTEIVDRLQGKKHFRATGLQMTCFNPPLDHTRQPRLGFPCLQHVGVTYEGDDGIAITGFYPSQHIFDRAYGNFLGLAHLGHFLGAKSRLALRRVNCIATRPMLGAKITKAAVRKLRQVVGQRLEALN